MMKFLDHSELNCFKGIFFRRNPRVGSLTDKLSSTSFQQNISQDTTSTIPSALSARESLTNWSNASMHQNLYRAHFQHYSPILSHSNAVTDLALAI
ncbi:hypothetical protein HHI36_014409, partial [Cryptolaemus montrouzieri]